MTRHYYMTLFQPKNDTTASSFSSPHLPSACRVDQELARMADVVRRCGHPYTADQILSARESLQACWPDPLHDASVTLPVA